LAFQQFGHSGNDASLVYSSEAFFLSITPAGADTVTRVKSARTTKTDLIGIDPIKNSAVV
jgi:hypothetical protein